MANDDDYYLGENPFDGYIVTSVNPGLLLLTLTCCYVFLTVFLAVILRFRSSRKRNSKEYDTNDLSVKVKLPKKKKLNSKKKKERDSSNTKAGMELLDAGFSSVDMATISKNSQFSHIEELNIPWRRKKKYLTARRRGIMKNKSFFSRSVPRRSSMSQSSTSQEDEEMFSSKEGIYIFELAKSDISMMSSKGGARKNNKPVLGNSQRTISASQISARSHNLDASQSSARSHNLDASQSSARSHNLDASGVEGDDYKQMTDEEPEKKKRETETDFNTELKAMFNLARPWAFGSFVSSTASIITLALISHYMGAAEMICYSYVWFILDASHIIPDAIFDSLYKHANNCVASETDLGYKNAGKYIQLCILVNAFISTPICIGMVFSMGTFVQMFGYGAKIAKLSYDYTFIACVTRLVSTSSGFVTIIPDLSGHADFDATYGLFDSLIDIALASFVIPFLQPTLFQLGLIHFAHDILSMIVYYTITGLKGWYKKYNVGLFGKLDLAGNDKKMIKSLLKKTIPLTFDAITGELEWFVLTFYAAYLGPAEGATWILISYIWGFVGILPGCIASASEYRVAHLLSINEIPLAKKLSGAAIWLTVLSSAIGSIILYFFRDYIVDGVTQDQTIDGMLLEIIPYIVICDPPLSIATAAEYLNRALAMYTRSTKLELLLTILVTIPAATFSTYVMGYNIEGMAAAAYFGYSSIGFFSIMMFANADWNKAAMKNQLMAGECTDDDDDDSEEEEEEEEEGKEENLFDEGQLHIEDVMKRTLMV